MTIEEAMRLLFSKIQILGEERELIKTAVKTELNELTTAEMLKFLIQSNSLGIIENAPDGSFLDPENYFKNMELPEELFMLLNGSDRSLYFKIRKVISNNFFNFSVKLEYITKYPKAFIFDFIPITQDTFREIRIARPDFIFFYENFSDQFKKQFSYEKKYSEKLITDIIENTNFAGNSVPPNNWFWQDEEKRTNPKIIDIVNNVLENNLVSPDIMKPQAFRNALLELRKKKSGLADKFPQLCSKLKSKYENPKNKELLEFKNRVVKDIIEKYFSADGALSVFKDEFFLPFLSTPSENQKIFDYGPLFKLYSFGNEENNLCLQENITEKIGNYMGNPVGAILFLNDLFATSSQYISDILPYLNFNASAFVIKYLKSNKESLNSARIAFTSVDFDKNFLNFKNTINKLLEEEIKGKPELEEKYESLINWALEVSSI